MYLDLHSFNARVKHETLWVYGVVFGSEDVAIGMLHRIQKLHKTINVNVFHTCAICDVEDAYKSTIWQFAYDTCEQRHLIKNELYLPGADINPTTISPTVCPFMNSGELI